MYIIKIILVLLPFVCCVSNISAQKQVAVYVTGNQTESIKKVLGSKMVTYLTNSSEFTAIERTSDFLGALTSEHDYQSSGEVSNAQIVELGSQFGAEYVAVVDVEELYGELFVSARLINVKTAGIQSSYEESSAISTMQGLTNLANNIADGLILAPERKVRQAQEAQKMAEQKKQENANLRAEAIRNFTPAGCRILGRFIVQNNAYPVTFSVNGVSVSPNISLPYGFRMATQGELNELYNNGARWNNLAIITNRQIHAVNDYKSKFDCEWQVPGFCNGDTGNVSVCITKWIKNHLTIDFEFPVYVVAIKDAPTEYQIQAEMNRIKLSR